MSEQRVIVVGAGLAGLCCARHLARAGISVLVLESGDEVGGRVRTEHVDGFLLDRGFQVLLTSYPEVQQVLDLDALRLQAYRAGALVRVQDRWHQFADPWRSPQSIFASLRAPVGSFLDKLRVQRLKARACRGELHQLYARPEQTTLEVLQEAGISSTMIDRFWRPFLGGVFLEEELRTSSRMFDFVFRMFATGKATLPAAGMGAIPAQIAEQLPSDSLRLNCRVSAVAADHVTLESGEKLTASAVVLATEGTKQTELLGEPYEEVEGRGVHCLHYAANRAPITSPILLLNGTGKGPINNMSFPSQVAPSYAPKDKTLVSVSVLDEAAKGMSAAELELSVHDQLANWFGQQAESWRLVKNWHIKYALPETSPTHLEPVQKPAQHSSGVYVCGDAYDTASIQGAMESGRRAAESIEPQLQARS